ncbi:tellurite resistance TerB family protein [Thalassococcus sp. BH17M4-6]|uniref:tellurite resistance TerB family protein n=1 Tax=Thalassococcus sp. BH17M4-6 TaxID=3413148 RepID=UPI003BDE23A0
MGLFSNLRKGKVEPVDTTLARAMLTMPVLAGAADGKFEESETREIVTLCAQNAVFLRLGYDRTEALIKEIVIDMKKRGAQAIFKEAVAVMPQEMRETALCFAVRVSAADGHVDKSEFEALKVMGQTMMIPPERFIQIFEVLMMLHRAPRAA